MPRGRRGGVDERPPSEVMELARATGSRARPLERAADLDPLMERIGDARYVLLGEASHGTSEFYTWRAELSKRLIAERDFSFIAVEGDWPDCYRLNRFVKGMRDAGRNAYDVLHAFERWPTWMWANGEVMELVTWLREVNKGRAAQRQAGFYGLDVYSLWDSMHAVVKYLEGLDPELAAGARRAYRCFEPYGEDVQEYARATYLVPTSCEAEAVSVLRTMRERVARWEDGNGDAYFDAEQNALVARNAELYYRTMVRGGPGSWNVRDHHMVETLERLMQHHGPISRCIVWEHNTHVGDARFTDMARGGMVNVGQLVRQAHDEEGVVIVGFGTHRGTVIAGDEWGAPMQRMEVPPGRPGSWEDACHWATRRNMLLLFDGNDDGGIAGLEEPIGHRAIGVVYDPRVEHWENYVPTQVARRYDAFVFIDESKGVDALHLPVRVDGEAPETYPSAM